MDRNWAEEAKALLKAELKRRSLSYADLAGRLTEGGRPMTEASLTKKISRGGFSAAFLLEALAAIGCTEVRL